MPPRRVRRVAAEDLRNRRTGRGGGLITRRGEGAAKRGFSFIGVPAGIAPAPPNIGVDRRRLRRRRDGLQDILEIGFDLRDVLEVILAARRPGLDWPLAALIVHPARELFVQRAKVRPALVLALRLVLDAAAWAASALEPAPHSSSSSAACLRFFPISLARFKV